MYELCNVKDNTYYINCPAKIGLYIDGTDAYLIDSGNDKDAGKKVKRILDENGWSLKAVVNTHSHADHIGGNKYLCQQTGCKIYAKGVERAFTCSPVMEPSFLYGAYPHKDLMHKFLKADESECLDVSDEGFPSFLEIIDLPGHSFDMIGIRTPDNVVFLADCVSSEATIRKYGISYLYNVSDYIETLEAIYNISADVFVPSHADVCENITELALFNKQSVFEIMDVILSYVDTPVTFEELLTKIFEHYGLVMTNEQYVLIGSALKAYLSYLKDNSKIQSTIENNRMLWSRV